MQLGLVLDGFTRNEMLFDVAQGGSLRRATTTGQEVVRRGHNPDSFRTMINRKARISASDYGSANGNRTRILALKGLRANRCTIAPQLLRLRLYLGYEKWRALTSTTAAPRQWSPFRQSARPWGEQLSVLRKDNVPA